MDHHDHSLKRDLRAMLETTPGRRRSLRWLVGAAALPLLGCGGSSDGTAAGTGTATSGTTPATPSTPGTPATGACATIPEETGGPYPADGTNANSGGVVNVLDQAGVVRSDIRSSFGGAGATAAGASAAGVPLTIRLHLVNANDACAAAGKLAVYLWHCDRDGNYSLYSSGVTGQNYLRGVQEADGNGDIVFTTIFPGCYAGRMPHVHFEVYPTLARAASAANRIRTSQFTFPLATCNEVYASTGYGASVRNLAQMSFASDNVFSDGYSLQLASMTGNPADGYVATLTVAVAA